MRPPICAVCDKDFRGDSDLSGGLVSFTDFKSLPAGVVGHPIGMEWFCSKHIRKARILAHLSAKAAIDEIKLHR